MVFLVEICITPWLAKHTPITYHGLTHYRISPNTNRPIYTRAHGINCAFRSLRPRVFLVLDLTRRREGRERREGNPLCYHVLHVVVIQPTIKKAQFVAVRSIDCETGLLRCGYRGRNERICSMDPGYRATSPALRDTSHHPL